MPYSIARKDLASGLELDLTGVGKFRQVHTGQAWISSPVEITSSLNPSPNSMQKNTKPETPPRRRSGQQLPREDGMETSMGLEERFSM